MESDSIRQKPRGRARGPCIVQLSGSWDREGSAVTVAKRFSCFAACGNCHIEKGYQAWEQNTSARWRSCVCGVVDARWERCRSREEVHEKHNHTHKPRSERCGFAE